MQKKLTIGEAVSARAPYQGGVAPNRLVGRRRFFGKRSEQLARRDPDLGQGTPLDQDAGNPRISRPVSASQK
jgi:hypothetical protein